jgi:hypothetical protein
LSGQASEGNLKPTLTNRSNKKLKYGSLYSFLIRRNGKEISEKKVA